MSIDRLRCRGITLVEQIVFIVIIGVGVVGLLSTMNSMVRFSADPMVRKQMVVIAESLLSEILHQPFTWCDPDDANATTAMDYVAGATFSGTQVCAGGAGYTQNKGDDSSTVPLVSPTPHAAGLSETRDGGPGTQFDNVADYGGFSQADATDAAGGNQVTGYATSVAVTRAGNSFGLSQSAVLQITVTVSKDADSISLTGWRFRYAPRY